MPIHRGYVIYKPWGGQGAYKAWGFPGAYKSLSAIKRAINKKVSSDPKWIRRVRRPGGTKAKFRKRKL